MADAAAKSAALGDVKGPMDAASQQAWGAFFWQHRNGTVDPDTRARLQNGGEAQAQWILSQLYSAFSGVSGKELQNDPLMLMRGSQLAMAKNGQRLRLMDGWLVTQDPVATTGICCTANWRDRRLICSKPTSSSRP
ncbi:hypothetical protein ECZU24_00950 [Escherichia coli]|nr:hypothetical protein ECZU24_00950 [Escherichia coli]